VGRYETVCGETVSIVVVVEGGGRGARSKIEEGAVVMGGLMEGYINDAGVKLMLRDLN